MKSLKYKIFNFNFENISKGSQYSVDKTVANKNNNSVNMSNVSANDWITLYYKQTKKFFKGVNDNLSKFEEDDNI